MEISKRPDEEFRQGSPRTHTAARGLKAGNSCPCPFSEEGWVVPLVGEGGSKSVGWGLGVAWVVCPFPGGAVCRDHTLLLLPASREMAVGFDLFLSSCAALS